MKKSRRHALGQHFLANRFVLRKIVDVISPTGNDTLVEVGAGKGILTKALAEFAVRLRFLGISNFLYADGDTLFAHSDHRIPPGSEEIHPGLYTLERGCPEAVPELSGSGVTLTMAEQTLTLAASVPLTEEKWQPMARGELLAIAGGAVLLSRSTVAPDEPAVSRPSG